VTASRRARARCAVRGAVSAAAAAAAAARRRRRHTRCHRQACPAGVPIAPRAPHPATTSNSRTHTHHHNTTDPTTLEQIDGRWQLLYTSRPGTASPIQVWLCGVGVVGMARDRGCVCGSCAGAALHPLAEPPPADRHTLPPHPRWPR
jgi:hypothetical protein